MDKKITLFPDKGSSIVFQIKIAQFYDKIICSLFSSNSPQHKNVPK